MAARSARGLLAIVVFLVVYGSLYPFEFVRTPNYGGFLSLEPGQSGVADFVLNLFLYAPVGFLIFHSLEAGGRGRRIAVACIAGTLMSAAVEMAQGFDLMRDSSLSDIVSNGLGSLAGAMLAAALPAFSLKRKVALRPALLCMFWALFQLYPLLPQLSGAALAHSAAGFHQWSWFEALLFAVDWFTAFALLSEALPLSRRGSAAWLVLLMPVKLILFERGLRASEVAGALAALALFVLLRRARLETRAFAAILIVVLIARELAPFRFGPPSGFGWLPFGASLFQQTVSAVVVLLRKAFVYGSAVWFLSQTAMRIRSATMSVAVLLLPLEWVQRWIPGRTPEITDSVLALVMGAVLALLTSSTAWDSQSNEPKAT